MPARFQDLPPAAQASVLALAAREDLGRPRAVRRRAARPPSPGPTAPPAFPGVSLAPAVRAWDWRKHLKCGWEGIGRCCYCES